MNWPVAFMSTLLLFKIIPANGCNLHQLRTRCHELLGDRPGFNTIVQGDTWKIGRQPDQHYVVILPTNTKSDQSKSQLRIIKDCTNDAFFADSHLGTYIQIGAFYRRVEAENLSKVLECQRIDARVVYFP
jgi:hypothetical protein